MDDKGKTDINFEGITVSVSEDKQISKIESLLKIASFSKLTSLIEKY